MTHLGGKTRVEQKLKIFLPFPITKADFTFSLYKQHWAVTQEDK